MSKTTTVAAANGSAASDDRPCGVAALRDREAKALVSLVCDVLSETHEVVHRLHTAIYKGDAKDSATELVCQVVDALVCWQATDHYLRMLRDVIEEQGNRSAAPWTAEPAF